MTTQQTILANLTPKQREARKRALEARALRAKGFVTITAGSHLDLLYKPVPVPLANPVVRP